MSPFRSNPAAYFGRGSRGTKEFQRHVYCRFGILLLIATPVARVGVSIFAFIYQRDRLYTLITATVFCLLVIGCPWQSRVAPN
ncbi:MAG TPA: DUF1634 domain-containing protein [Candidatus Binatia bacterium]|nr:DUF1634 domain-containing protein [Candidatus Binatia bacterium]